MLRGVAEACRILGVERDQVKSWAHMFRDHLSTRANPSSGQPRQFTENDMFVLMHVMMHWEPDPDIESIRMSLNYESHIGNELYVRTLYTHTPILQERPEGLDESWGGGVFLNARLIDEFLAVARIYRESAGAMLDAALKSSDSRDWGYPVLYAYRHTLELYLKIIGHVEEFTHSLEHCVALVERRLDQKIGSPIREWIIEFDRIDPSGTAFRYADDAAGTLGDAEYWVDFHHLKYVMGLIFEALDHACLMVGRCSGVDEIYH